MLCQKAGIDSVYVRGFAISSQSSKEVGHAWNLVKLKDKYYAVDTTWGDPVFDQALSGQKQENINYNFLCLTDDILNRSHQANHDISYQEGLSIKNAWKLPECTDNSLLYGNGYYLESFQSDAIAETLKKQLDQGVSNPSVQFSEEADYEAFIADLDGNNNLYHDLFGSYWTNYSGYSYSMSPETLSINFMNN